MQMKEFDRDFVERTKWIVQNVKCQYEVTLLLNCMLGLVNLPTERSKNKTASNDSNDFRDACVQKLNELGVIKKRTDDEKTFRAVRNAVSHLHIDPSDQCQSNRCNSIKKIILSDIENGKSSPHTILEFSIEQLKDFALFVADKHLERLNSSQKKIPEEKSCG